MTKTYILSAPQGIGKTAAARQIAARLGCPTIIDDWDGRSSLPGNAIAVTNIVEHLRPAGSVAFQVEDKEGLAHLLDALAAKPGDDADQPVKIFRLPYAEDYYLCTCGAARRPECSCSHEHILDISENDHLHDPEIVEWLVEHREPFSLAEIKASLWMPIQNRNIDIHLSIRISRELTACGCVRDEKTGLFTPPSLDALRRLNLRAPAGSRSPAAGSAPSPHTEPQQDPRADRQAPSSASKAASDPQAPQ